MAKRKKTRLEKIPVSQLSFQVWNDFINVASTISELHIIQYLSWNDIMSLLSTSYRTHVSIINMLDVETKHITKTRKFYIYWYSKRMVENIEVIEK